MEFMHPSIHPTNPTNNNNTGEREGKREIKKMKECQRNKQHKIHIPRTQCPIFTTFPPNKSPSTVTEMRKLSQIIDINKRWGN